jgi:hypothetical protein
MAYMKDAAGRRIDQFTVADAGKLPVNVAAYGVDPTRTAAQNSAAFASALAVAAAAGRDLYVPAFAGTIQISATITVTTPRLRIVGAGRGSHIQQTVVGIPAIALNADGAAVEGLQLSNATRSVATVTSDATDIQSDGSQLSMGHCGVQVGRGTTGVRVRNIYGHTFHAVVTALAYGPASPLIYQLTVENVDHDDVAFGVKVRGLVDPIVRGIRGTYSLTPGIGHPPHGVYFSQTTDVPFSTNILLDGVHQWDGTIGAAVKLAAVDSGVVTNIAARHCRGLLDLLALNDVRISGISDIDDANDETLPGAVKATINLETCTRVTVASGKVVHGTVNPWHGIFLATDTVECVISDIDLTMKFATAQTGADLDSVSVYGTNNVLRNVSVRNIGAARGSGIRLDQSTGTRLIRPRVSGEHVNAIYNKTAAISSEVDYVPADVAPSATQASSRQILTGSQSALPTLRIPAAPASEVDRPTIWFGNTQALGTDTNASFWSSGHVATRNQTWLFEGSSIYNSTNNSNAATWVAFPNANVDIESRILFNGTRAGLALKVIDASNYLVCDLSTAGVVVGERLSAGVTDLATFAKTLTTGREYTLRVIVFGSTVEAYLDGGLVLTYTLTAGQQTTYGASKNYGLHAASAGAARFRWAKLRIV